jgi:hypothetical protein
MDPAPRRGGMQERRHLFLPGLPLKLAGNAARLFDFDLADLASNRISAEA